MKKTILSIFSAAMLVSLAASAATTEATGVVKTIRVHDTGLGSDRDWFALKSTPSALDCATYDGDVAFIIRSGEQGRRMIAQLNAALLSGRSIRVGVDSNLKSGSYCFANYVDILD